MCVHMNCVLAQGSPLKVNTGFLHPVPVVLPRNPPNIPISFLSHADTSRLAMLITYVERPLICLQPAPHAWDQQKRGEKRRKLSYVTPVVRAEEERRGLEYEQRKNL